MINPFVQKLIGSVVRALLVGAGGYLVAKAVASEADVSGIVESLTPILAGLVWSFYEKYNSRQKLLTAQVMPAGATEEQVKAQIKFVGAPPVTLAIDQVPYTPPGKKDL